MTAPEKRFQVGNCAASVFVNDIETRDGPRQVRSVRLERVYKGADGEFRWTAVLRKNDLPKAVIVLEQAFEYLATLREPSGARPGPTKGGASRNGPEAKPF
jgi:hypothetical protein